MLPYDFSFVSLIAITLLVILIFLLFYTPQKLPCLGPRFPFGSILRLRCRENFGRLAQDIYREMKTKKWKHGVVYFTATPTYFVVDLDHVQNVMKRDFQYFTDRGIYYNEQHDPIGVHLFSIGGPKWQKLRHRLSPTFTSAKIRAMFHTLAECGTTLERRMAKEASHGEPVEAKGVLECFTIDIIGSCAFGLELKSFDKEDSPFRVYGKKIFAISKWSFFEILFRVGFPEMAKTLGARAVPKCISDFFTKVVQDIMVHRQTSNCTRKDFFQLLLDLKNNGDANSLTFEEIVAQCFIFFLAGFETSSATLSFALYELARHGHIQDRVRQEIFQTLNKHKGVITYEAIQEMKYLDQVIDETLRKYPPLPFITRKCVRDYQVPYGTIRKGTIVIIPVAGIHYDQDLYPNPTEFNPERFNTENKNKRDRFAFIPFGEGPRKCIGMRFGLLQTKVGLVSGLKNYKFTVNEKTQEPLKYNVGFFLSVEGGIWLNAAKLESLY